MPETEYVWRARRFWLQEPIPGLRVPVGWNTDFQRCPVFKKTAKRVGIVAPSLGTLWLNREALERDGKVYHSKPHEYFYKVKPAVDPEHSNAVWATRFRGGPDCLRVLGLSWGCSRADVKRAYRKLARARHPDAGGSHEEFLKLSRAYESALRLAS